VKQHRDVSNEPHTHASKHQLSEDGMAVCADLTYSFCSCSVQLPQPMSGRMLLTTGARHAGARVRAGEQPHRSGRARIQVARRAHFQQQCAAQGARRFTYSGQQVELHALNKSIAPRNRREGVGRTGGLWHLPHACLLVPDSCHIGARMLISYKSQHAQRTGAWTVCWFGAHCRRAFMRCYCMLAEWQMMRL